jgi:hypothetical protein
MVQKLLLAMLASHLESHMVTLATKPSPLYP